ncbi:5-oxoprolinase subunit PxpA [Abyssalbus ytuae]|uniref:5-oxoprolinase subunit PxpA n=1 Tax=Abyssalbus ytuae TaxID=2926907 RepID=A0A9E6ZTV8_9FLAO|nr:5-oxoprolinase subunit PxpA [Abyssalbus ytuae]UOB17713.1 5-oxoprolinase subunit PxpA [Abyssalbus ytuae]
MNYIIDINCDMGEGMNNEHLFMPYITSCNIACGGHAGDKETMGRVINLACEYKVNIGAHPSYPDKENFGRKSVNISNENLIKSVRKQIKNLKEVADSLNCKLNHIKPHGALYNEVAEDMDLANVFLEAIKEYKDSCTLYVLSNSFAATLARQSGFKVREEAYADRNYNNDLSLVSRVKENAVITDANQVVEHISLMLKGKVKTITGNLVSINADTFCIHSDTENAEKLVKVLHEKLINSGYSVK